MSFVAKVRWSLLSNSSSEVEEGGEGKRDSSNQGRSTQKRLLLRYSGAFARMVNLMNKFISISQNLSYPLVLWLVQS